MITKHAASILEMHVSPEEAAYILGSKPSDTPKKKKVELLSSSNLLTGGITGGLAGLATGIGTKNPYVGLGIGLAGLGIGTGIGYKKDLDEAESQYQDMKRLHDVVHNKNFSADAAMIFDQDGRKVWSSH